MERVVVTGASGFIGRNLLAYLARHRGCHVSAVVRSEQSARRLAHSRVQVHVGDFWNEAFTRQVCANATHVVHLAGVVAPFSRAYTNRINVEMTGRLAAGLSGLVSPPVLLYISSLAAAGPAEPFRPRRESDRCTPCSIYGRSKLAAEETLRTHAERLPITVIRPPAVIGMWDRNLLEMHHSIRWGLNPVGISKRFRYSFVHAEDLSHGVWLAATHGRRLKRDPGDSQGIYFIADPAPLTMVDLANQVAASVGRRPPLHVRIPAPLCWGIAGLSEAAGRWLKQRTFLNFDKMREASAGSWICDTSRAEQELGFSVALPLSERIAHTSRWYEQQGWI